MYGQLGDGTTTDRYVPTPVSSNEVSSWLAISAGGGHTCGLAAGSDLNGKAYCWGESRPPPLPATNPPQLLQGLAYSAVALSATIRGRNLAGANWSGQLGDNSTIDQNVPTPVSNSTVSSWLTISAGGSYVCGLAAGSGLDGKAYCWGESPPRLSMKSPHWEV
jgi:hypothetical protein